MTPPSLPPQHSFHQYDHENSREAPHEIHHAHDLIQTHLHRCAHLFIITDDMSAAEECFESLKIASIISETREEKNLPGKRELHIPGRASALLDSHAELIAFPKHSCLNHISRRLSAAENENSLPYTSKSGNQKRHQISPHSVLFPSWHSRETWFKMLHCRETRDETVTKVERCLA